MPLSDGTRKFSWVSLTEMEPCLECAGRMEKQGVVRMNDFCVEIVRLH